MPHPSLNDIALALALFGFLIIGLAANDAFAGMNRSKTQRRLRAVIIWAGVLSFLTGAGIGLPRLFDSRERAIERHAAYADAVADQLQDRYGLQVLSLDTRKLPDRDDLTMRDVRMERGDDLVLCVLNTRTGPASVTAHCQPLNPRNA